MPNKKKSISREREKYLVEKIHIPDSNAFFYYVNCNSFTATFNSMRDLEKYIGKESYRGNYIWF